MPTYLAEPGRTRTLPINPPVIEQTELVFLEDVRPEVDVFSGDPATGNVTYYDTSYYTFGGGYKPPPTPPKEVPYSETKEWGALSGISRFGPVTVPSPTGQIFTNYSRISYPSFMAVQGAGGLGTDPETMIDIPESYIFHPGQFAAGSVGAVEGIVNPSVPTLWSPLYPDSMQSDFIKSHPDYAFGSLASELAMFAVPLPKFVSEVVHLPGVIRSVKSSYIGKFISEGLTDFKVWKESQPIFFNAQKLSKEFKFSRMLAEVDDPLEQMALRQEMSAPRYAYADKSMFKRPYLNPSDNPLEPSIGFIFEQTPIEKKIAEKGFYGGNEWKSWAGTTRSPELENLTRAKPYFTPMEFDDFASSIEQSFSASVQPLKQSSSIRLRGLAGFAGAIPAGTQIVPMPEFKYAYDQTSRISSSSSTKSKTYPFVIFKPTLDIATDIDTTPEQEYIVIPKVRTALIQEYRQVQVQPIPTPKPIITEPRYTYRQFPINFPRRFIGRYPDEDMPEFFKGRKGKRWTEKRTAPFNPDFLGMAGKFRRYLD